MNVAHDRLLRETLEKGLSVQRERAVKIRELHVQDCGCLSSFAVARFRLTLDDGDSLGVFFKDLNPRHQVLEARSVRAPGLARSRRELWMYSEALDHARLGTPQLYGHRWEPHAGHFWLLLEDVGDTRLTWVEDFSLWLAVVRWLASFHTAMAHVAETDGGMLLRHDVAGFRQRAKQLAEHPPDVAPAQHALIRQALELHDEVVDSIDEQPWGLIHGEFFDKNVIISSGTDARRIAVVDWETAAHGPLYRDLADITAGAWNRADRLTMWRAYHDQYCRDSGRDLPWEQFCRDVRNMALTHAIGWLAWWAQGERRHIDRCMDNLQRIMSEVVDDQS